MKGIRVDSFQLGWIEGFYGKPWSWQERLELVELLAHAGYRSYVYAPKMDHFLRKRWREPFPRAQIQQFEKLIDSCHAAEVTFGIGISPLGVCRSLDAQSWSDLKAKIEVIDSLGVDRLDILFDDMRGDFPDLARTQAEILHRVADFSKARTFTICPTYYSEDPVLERMFGPRPGGYLEELGRKLDPKIGVYWTGERIVSKRYSPSHLADVSQKLARKLTLWDNYPVNDTPALCKFLHLRGFTGRPAEMAEYLREHMINPMNQPHLSLIPAGTLVMNYAQSDSYSAAQAFTDCAREILGDAFGGEVETDLSLFADAGLDSISAEQKTALLAKYSCFDHPAAREIENWLKGDYLITAEQIRETHGLSQT